MTSSEKIDAEDFANALTLAVKQVGNLSTLMNYWGNSNYGKTYDLLGSVSLSNVPSDKSIQNDIDEIKKYITILGGDPDKAKCIIKDDMGNRNYMIKYNFGHNWK